MTEPTNKLSNPDAPIQDANLYLAFQLMQRKEFDTAEEHIKKGIKAARDQKDEILEGIYLSAMGVLFKLKKDFKKSYKSYQQAEKLLKDDHSVKIISALLLIEEFKQYETAIRKLDKVVEVSEDPAITHHALCVQALAYFHMKKKDKAKQVLQLALAQDFNALKSAANIEFKAVQIFAQDGFCLDLCLEFLQKALKLAQKTKEAIYVAVIQNLILLVDQKGK